MNSAPSVSTNRTRKIQNAHQPRRLALKFCQRRWLIGDRSTMLRRGGTTTPIGATGLVSMGRGVVASTSCLPRLEMDAWIGPSKGEVGDQVDPEPDKREVKERGKDHGVVAIQDA